MNIESLKSINYIIERDSKDTTYKFALLRSVIETVQYFDHLKIEDEKNVTFPLGLLIEKWIFYYYPLIENDIPQKYGESKSGRALTFKPYLVKLVDFYKDKGGISAFYLDYKNGNLPEEIRDTFLILTTELRNTITNMPMRYLGKSYFHKEYSIFKFNKDSGRIKKKNLQERIDREFLIKNFGTFSFPKELYVVFLYFGSFLNGTESIIYKWAEFSTNIDKTKNLTVEKVLESLLTKPETDRDVKLAKDIYKELIRKTGKIECVWSGQSITMRNLNVDHVLPFSIWQNNDLWNLLPAHAKVNRDKKDKIPAPDFIYQRKDKIIHYWKIIHFVCRERFEKEIFTNLIGLDKSHVVKNLFEEGVKHLLQKAKYLIDIRGYEPWKL